MTQERYAQRLEREVKSRVAADLAEHQVEVLRSDGMYRHYRCQKPGTWNMGFDIVTWPGSLCYTGDMGDYLFQRTEDMVAFMRGACRDYRYAAEKCVAHDGKLREFREERMEELLQEAMEERDEFMVYTSPAGSFRVVKTADAVAAIRQAYQNYSFSHDALTAMYESGIWDGADLPSCDEYTFHFLWCLHAIKWFCERVGAA